MILFVATFVWCICVEVWGFAEFETVCVCVRE